MMPTSSGSEARWREEAMPGETFGEVMRRKASAEVMPPSVGRNAGKDRARSQCPEKHPGTQGPLRGDENSWRGKEASSPLNGSPFTEENCS